jgi:hypothetical protein
MCYSPLDLLGKNSVTSQNVLEPNRGTLDLIIGYAAGVTRKLREMSQHSLKRTVGRLAETVMLIQGFSNCKVLWGNQVTPKCFQYCQFFRRHSSWICKSSVAHFPKCVSWVEMDTAVWLVGNVTACSCTWEDVPEVMETLGVQLATSKAQVVRKWNSCACWFPILNVSFCLKHLYHIPNVTGIVGEVN